MITIEVVGGQTSKQTDWKNAVKAVKDMGGVYDGDTQTWIVDATHHVAAYYIERGVQYYGLRVVEPAEETAPVTTPIDLNEGGEGYDPYWEGTMPGPVATLSETQPETDTTQTEVAIMEEPHCTIHPATREQMTSRGITAQVGALPQDTPVDYYRVQVDQASEWIELAILPTGALLAWGADPTFLEGCSTPQEALEMFFAEDDEDDA